MGMLFNVASDFSTSPDALPVALSTTFKTQLSGLAQTATLRRGKITELAIGPISNPVANDCNIIYAIQRQTANNGTPGGPVTPEFVPVLEAGSAPAAGSAWRTNYTAEPTYANRIFTKWLNQHSGFVWYAPDDIGLPWPATNNNGLACMAKGATADYTGTVGWEVKFDE